MSTELKLKNIAQEYSSFRDNQVLTATQLNELIRYFDDQGRLTRTALSGVGIVCGLDVSTNLAGPSISVSRGCGITTDGDLLSSEAKTFRFYKSFDDQWATYSKFWDNGVQYPIWEVFTGDEDPAIVDTKAMSGFTGETGINFEDLSLVLYLESYPKTPDLCTALDCDNQGEKQVAKIRFLLIERNNLETIATTDAIYSKYQTAKSDYALLPRVPQQRVIINSNNSLTITNLAVAYRNAVNSSRNSLWDAIELTYNKFSNWIDPKGQVVISDLKNIYFQRFPFLAFNNTIKLHFQYYYDLQKELIQAYHELRTSLQNLLVECLPDITAFPRHLMLSDLGGKLKVHRHDFYPSPIISDKDERIVLAQSQFLRIMYMLIDFEVDSKTNEEIKFTPSIARPRPLQESSIPFYYNPSANLLNNWDFHRARLNRVDTLLSYNAYQYSSKDDIVRPLVYDIDDYKFLRVEGHIGQDYRNVMEEVINIKKDNGLGFDVIALKVGDGATDIDLRDYDCQFENMNAVFEAWKAEQNCLNAAISSFFSGFDLIRPGQHVGYIKLQEQDVFTPAAGPVIGIGSPTIGVKGGGSGFPTLQDGFGLSEAASDRYYLGGLDVVYEQDTTVKDNLEVSEGTLGEGFLDVLDQSDLFSAADIKEGIKDIIGDIIIGDGWNDENRDIAVNFPIEVIARLDQVGRNLPASIYEISPEGIQNLNQAVEGLCNAAETIKRSASAIFKSPNYIEQGYEDQYIYFLNQMTMNCCAAEKLEVLMDEIQIQKQKILDLVSFPNYAVKHPGLEHKAGVPRGGTLVLVYSDTQPTVDPNSRAIAALGNDRLSISDSLLGLTKKTTLGIKETEVRGFQSFSGPTPVRGAVAPTSAVPTSKKSTSKDFVEYIAANDGNLNINNEIEVFLKDNGLKGDSPLGNLLRGNIAELIGSKRFRQELNVPRYTVIADFCLPYQCCSDCPPVVFMLPKQTVSLRLPVLFACRAADAKPIPFEVSPVDGIVKANQGGDALVTLVNGRYFFNPALVPDNLLGEAIGFTVNDQVTDTVITVYKKPEPTFSEGNRQRLKEDTLEEVTFVNGTPLGTDDNFQWEWDFGDGTLPTERTARNPIHLYDLDKLRDANTPTLTVRLTVTNGRCQESVTEDITFDLTVPDKPIEGCTKDTISLLEKERSMLINLQESDTSEFKDSITKVLDLYTIVLTENKSTLTGERNEEILQQIQELMAQISEAAIQTGPPKGNILAVLAGELVKLSMLVLRCQTKLVIKETSLIELLGSIQGNFSELPGQYFILAESRNLRTFIESFLKNTPLTEETLISWIKQFLEMRI